MAEEDPPLARTLGAARDVTAVAGTALDFGLCAARFSARLGFGATRAGLRGTACAFEAVAVVGAGGGRVGGVVGGAAAGLRAADGAVGFAEGLTNMGITAGFGAAGCAISATHEGLGAAAEDARRRAAAAHDDAIGDDAAAVRLAGAPASAC